MAQKTSNLVALALSFYMGSFVTPSHARDCPSLTLEEQFKAAKVAFAGRLIKSEHIGLDDFNEHRPAIYNGLTFEIYKHWKYGGQIGLKGPKEDGPAERYHTLEKSPLVLGNTYLVMLTETNDAVQNRGLIINECTFVKEFRPGSVLDKTLDKLAITQRPRLQGEIAYEHDFKP